MRTKVAATTGNNTKQIIKNEPALESQQRAQGINITFHANLQNVESVADRRCFANIDDEPHRHNEKRKERHQKLWDILCRRG